MFGTPDNNDNDVAGNKTETSVTLTTWMLVLIIAGVLLVATMFVFIIVYFMRKRRVAQAAKRDRTNRQNSLLFRKRNISAADRAEAEELERSLMIRKSLASRTWSLSSTRDSRHLESARSSRSLVDIQMEPVPEVVGAGGSRDVNKDWEARALTRANAVVEDPALQGRGHPAFSLELGQIAVPQPSVTQSPTRNMKGLQAGNPLPPIPLPPPPPYERDAS